MPGGSCEESQSATFPAEVPEDAESLTPPLPVAVPQAAADGAETGFACLRLDFMTVLSFGQKRLTVLRYLIFGSQWIQKPLRLLYFQTNLGTFPTKPLVL